MLKAAEIYIAIEYTFLNTRIDGINLISKDLYQTYISDQDFQVARDTGNLEDFARAYPLSQTAKKMRSKAPYGRPVDF